MISEEDWQAGVAALVRQVRHHKDIGTPFEIDLFAKDMFMEGFRKGIEHERKKHIPDAKKMVEQVREKHWRIRMVTNNLSLCH